MQEIIVAVIGVLVLIFIGWKLYKFFTRKPDVNNRCAGCDIDCALKDMNPKDCDKDKKD